VDIIRGITVPRLRPPAWRIKTSKRRRTASRTSCSGAGAELVEEGKPVVVEVVVDDGEEVEVEVEVN
jgi:hypothetical protein